MTDRAKEAPLPQPVPGQGQFGVTPLAAGNHAPENPSNWTSPAPTILNPMPSGTGDTHPQVSAPAGAPGYPWGTPADAAPNPMPGQAQHGVTPGSSQGDLVNDMPETDPQAAGRPAGQHGPEAPYHNPGLSE